MTHPSPASTDARLILSREQQAILAHPGKSAIASALAGTGKTTTLASKVAQACASGKSQRILVLAYSRAGVAAFHHRLGRLMREIPPQVQITTLERWAAQQIRRQDPDARFEADRLVLHDQVRKARTSLEWRAQEQPDARLELSGELDLDAFWAFNLRAKKSLLPQTLQDSGTSLAQFCEEYLLDYGQACLFFEYERARVDTCGDVLYYAHGDCSYALACAVLDGQTLDTPAYDLVVLDEMHDLDLASLQVLRGLLQQSNGSFLGAGDFNQHIEAQAWSVFEDQLHRLDEFLPHATQSLPLTQSRRFGPEIAGAVNQWFDLDLKTTATRQSKVILQSYETDEECIALLLQAQAGLTRQASAQQASSLGAASLTVILRQPHEACALEWALHRAGKSASFYGFKRFYLEREVALLLGLCYAHSMQRLDWKADTCPLGLELLSAFVEGALYYGKGSVDAQAMDSASRHTQAQQMAGQMLHNPQIIWRFLRGESSLQGGQRNFAAFGSFLQLPLSLQADAQALLMQADVWGLFPSQARQDEPTRQLHHRVQSFVDSTAGMSVPQLLADISAMARRFERAVRAGQGFDFHLSTIEEAKGKEYEHVALPFLEPGRFPAPAARELAFLERNRLYVAMTRAKKKLWLLEHAQRRIQAFF
ncbi:UvrD-helicase domain-containing protein [Comamonas composti]|uniref:UvrD-helicase domain-containing protein n=1 Tax=Comamonas composti TaxID=408558 RepID=UPI0004098E6F|nr:UvrD-helicase domain-containing protein [Comamonas composti]